jgi:GNAT superfamily N-acetyltransferase
MSAAGEAEDACVSRAKPRPAERASAATAVHCAPMEAAMRGEAESLLAEFLRGDDHYLASSPVYGDGGAEALARALDLFLARPAIGFVWLAFADTAQRRIAVGACVVCHAISTSRGAVVAKLDDVTIRAGWQGRGIGTVMVNALSAHLTAQGITRIDCGCHRANTGAWRFYERLGFLPLDEERIALLL